MSSFGMGVEWVFGEGGREGGREGPGEGRLGDNNPSRESGERHLIIACLDILRAVCLPRTRVLLKGVEANSKH